MTDSCVSNFRRGTGHLGVLVLTLAALVCALGAIAVAAVVAVAPAAARTKPHELGRLWSKEALPKGLGVLSGVACVPAGASAHCVAVGEESSGNGAVVVSGDAGRTWALESVPAGVGLLYNVACSSASDCWADGQLTNAAKSATVIATRDGGSSWSVESLPAQQAQYGPLGNISCVGQHCWANEAHSNSVLATNDGGNHWSLQTLPQTCHTSLCGAAYISSDVTFVNTSDGYATGYNQCGGQGATHCPGIIWRTIDGGVKWQIVTAGKLPAVDAISCVDASHCWAAAATFATGEMYGTADGGAKWSHQTLPHFGGYFNDIRCVRRAHADRCFAVGQNEKATAAVIVQTADGGSHWLLDRAPSGTGPLGALSFVGTGARAVGENSTRTGAVALTS